MGTNKKIKFKKNKKRNKNRTTSYVKATTNSHINKHPFQRNYCALVQGHSFQLNIV